MNAHVSPPANVVRFPPRLRVISSGGIAAGKPCAGNGVEAISRPKTAGGLALDALLLAGTIDTRQHAAGLAYAALRRRYDRSGGSMRSWRDTSGMSDEAWQAIKRDHAILLRAAGAERFVLDRLCLGNETPLACEMGRVCEALERVAAQLSACGVIPLPL